MKLIELSGLPYVTKLAGKQGGHREFDNGKIELYTHGRNRSDNEWKGICVL